MIFFHSKKVFELVSNLIKQCRTSIEASPCILLRILMTSALPQPPACYKKAVHL